MPSKRTVLAAAAAAVVAATPAGAHVGYPHPLFEDRQVVDSTAPERIGPGYACAVVTPRGGSGSRKLLVLVTTEAAATRARTVVRGLKHRRSARVRLTDPRLRRRTMDSVRRKVWAARPGGDTSKGIGFEAALYSSSCPRVEILIEPPGEASDEDERWARDSVAAWGEDRVVVNRAPFRPGRGE